MPTNGEALTAAFDSRDLLQLVDLMDARVVWRGIIDDGTQSDHEHDVDADEDEHDHAPPMCTDREQVRGVYESFLEGGGMGHPLVLAEVGETVVVDPRAEPPLAIPLHKAFTFRGRRVVLIQDYPDRSSALADLESPTTTG